MSLLVFLVLDEHFNGVTNGQVGVVAEFAAGDDTFALVADVHDYFAVVDAGDNTVNDVIVGNLVQRCLVGLGGLCLFGC